MADVAGFHDRQREAWQRVPVDGAGYMDTRVLLAATDDELRGIVGQMRSTRYGGWRNWRGLWRNVVGLDTTTGKRVLDYGCGIGLEALEYAKADNHVSVADINYENIKLAERVLRLHGHEPERMFIVSATGRVVDGSEVKPGQFHVVHCSGVLHHIPEPRPVVEEFHCVLAPGGEARLMLYSDEAWRKFGLGEPPADPVQDALGFESFVRAMDEVGEYATWYDAAKLDALVAPLFDVERFEYLCEDRRYCAAVLRRR